MEELINLPPEKILLRWMNFHLKKSECKKIVTNFSSDVKVTNDILSLILEVNHDARQFFMNKTHLLWQTLFCYLLHEINRDLKVIGNT
jgi:hypothetical protein